MGSTYGSIYTQRCHDPPLLASGGGRYINSTTYKYWCNSLSSMQGFNYIYCINNKWVGPIPQCVPKYAHPDVDTVIKVNRDIKQPEPLPDWFLLVTLGCLGVGGLTSIVGTLMCCLHILGCYSGPMLSVGTRHVYPKPPLCTCQDYCCCCCRCCTFCKMCCVGDEGDKDEEADDEQKVAMLKNEIDNQYPENTKESMVGIDESKLVQTDEIKIKRPVPNDKFGRKRKGQTLQNPQELKPKTTTATTNDKQATKEELG